ncbi:MAG: peptidoglycan DD-metalloendopeptidase family protein [Bacteroidaceae bacterium]|nr:peptidoglycan DD-metalloendopeptidase family protein [Bacteroidaceae bacterium]
MKSKFFVLLAFLSLSNNICTFADSKKVKDLKSQKAKIERGIQQSKNELQKTRQQTVKKEQTADFIEDQLQNRLEYIHRLENEIDTLQANVDRLEKEVGQLELQVNDRKQKYITSLRQARNSQSLRNPLLFMFSAETFPQIYRRMRYAREFAALQKNLGIQLIDKQNRARDKQNELLAAKQKMSELVQEVIRQRKQLAAEHSVVKANVAQLQKRQKEIEKQVAEQQKQLNALTKKIDELVAYELEQARKRAEAEARRKREAELAKAKKNAKSGSKGKTGKGTTSAKTPPPSKWLTAEDQKLNGNLEQNKGRLPVPITGPYRIARRFGLTQVTAGVTLDNKGTNYMGQSGARARAIFDGEVSAVFQLGSLKNVLVRHGSYISVYCNLSSTIVTRGQKVKARDILGTVADDGQGNYVLHFQLRKETAKLNPEVWIGR